MFLTSDDSSEPGDTVEALISEITVKLLRLGKYLNDNAKVLIHSIQNIVKKKFRKFNFFINHQELSI